MFLLHVTIFCFVVLVVEGSNLPPYIKACYRNDPKLNECCVKNGNAAIPHLVEGDRYLKVPNLQPLILPEIVLQATSQLSIKLKDVKVSGLENAVVTEVKADPKLRNVGGSLSLPRININSGYTINGRLLIIPIQGAGPAKVVCDNLVVKYKTHYNLTTKPDGKEYIDQEFVSSLSYTIGNVSFKFDNLFNGDKNLGDRTNEFLNEHANEISEDFSTSITGTVKYLIDTILKNFIALVPYDEIFLP